MTNTPQRGVSLAQDAWRRLRKSWTATTALWLLAVLGVLAVLAPLLPLQPPRRVETHRAFQSPTLAGPETPLFPPNALPEEKDASLAEGFGQLDPLSMLLLRARTAVFGTWSIPSVCGADKLGRDVLSRLFWGGRISLSVGLVAAMVSLVIGVAYGAVSAYAGGWVDNLMMRFVDVLYSVPFIFVVIFLITILNAEGIKEALERDYGVNRLVIFFFLVGAIYWLTMARVVRGQVLSLRNEPFVEAARALGASHGRILLHHIVPNLWSVVIVYLTLTIPRVMLLEAFLSFLGLGVEPPDVSWGLLANEGIQAITPIRIYWWLVAFPGLALGATLLALNFLGDGLRHDPPPCGPALASCFDMEPALTTLGDVVCCKPGTLRYCVVGACRNLTGPRESTNTTIMFGHHKPIAEMFAADEQIVVFPGDCLAFLQACPDEAFQLVVTSPPYNIGKEYEKRLTLDVYLDQQARVIRECVRCLSPRGSICWQVGNYVDKGAIIPATGLSGISSTACIVRNVFRGDTRQLSGLPSPTTMSLTSIPSGCPRNILARSTSKGRKPGSIRATLWVRILGTSG